LQAQLKTAQATTRPKFLIELAKPTKKKNCFKKFPTLQKNNSTYKKLAVQCHADSFVVAESLVLRINICGKNRQLLVAAKRYTHRTKMIFVTF
jgi:hypothetical protein